MPTSPLEIAPAALHYLWEIRPTDRPLRVLDVGPGWGKYGGLIREYVDPDAEVWAVEAWAPYIERHNLAGRYTKVIAGDIRNQPDKLLADFDAVLLIDVIEHLPKDDGRALLDRIPGWVIVSTPRHFFDNPDDLPPTEAHVSHWVLSDFSETGRLDGFHRDHARNLDVILCRLSPKVDEPTT